MPFEFKLAIRYFRMRRKSLARLTSVAAVVGIAAGVASLIIAQSLARGFQDEMRDKILGNTAHVSIFFKDGSEIANWIELKQNLEKIENIEEISPTAWSNVLVVGNEAISYAILRVQISNTTSSESSTEDKSLEISIGAELAEKIGAEIGDKLELITLENQTEPNRTKVLVSKIFRTGLFDYDSSWIDISPENFAKLKEHKHFTPTILSVSVKDIYQADDTARKIREALGGGFRVLDWQEANRPLFSALSLEKKVSLAIISLIIFIAALNITTTLTLLVNERRLDIAVLRTCGIKTRNLISIFLLEGSFLGISGIFLGLVLGLLGCFFGNYFKLISLPAEVYSLSYVPLHPSVTSIFWIILISLVLSLAATAYPAFLASRVKPLENLRKL